MYHSPVENEDLWCQRLPWYEAKFPGGVMWKIGVLGKPSAMFSSMPSDSSWPGEALWEDALTVQPHGGPPEIGKLG